MPEEPNINWDEEFPIARQVVNDWDPLALIQDGGPKEAYDFLTLKMFSGIKSDKSDTKIAQSVIELMDSYYQLPVEEYDLDGLKHQIIGVVKEMRIVLD